ncbi:MAG TPA: hypothetical protein PKL14_11550 [Holophaga sp.]|nr:hypothetical protein [Holophaga sp.]
MPFSVHSSILVAAASLGLLTACGGSSDATASPSNPPQPSKPTVTDVYVAGAETINKINVAKYWIGDQPVLLGDGKTESTANAITIDGGKVWVAGSVGGPGASRAVLWLNAKMTELSDPDHVPNANAFAWGVTAANGKIWLFVISCG